MDSETLCETCGTPIKLGDWPFCPHGKRGNYTNFRDEYPGGITLENYGPHPVTFYSESDRIAFMKAHGLEHREKWAPFPGTDRDPAGVQNPDGYIDDYTMKAREELFLRAHNSGAQDKDSVEGVISDTFAGHLTHRDAVAVAAGEPRRSSRVAQRIKKQIEEAHAGKTVDA